MDGLADELIAIINYIGHGSTSEPAIKFINAGLASLIMMLINFDHVDELSKKGGCTVGKSRKGVAKLDYDWFGQLRFSAAKPIKVKK